MLIPFKYLLFYPKKINGIIHIGAHELEELKDYLSRKIYKIIWIEANSKKYKKIEKKIKKYPQMILGKFAAGSKKEKLLLNIANNGQSSSLLDFGTHKDSYPEIKYTSKSEVEVLSLDSWISSKNLDQKDFNFLNMDIQGFELEALKGMNNQLDLIDFIYLEVNFKQVYKNCAEIKEIDNYLSNYKFHRVGIFKTKYEWGDAIYAKNNIPFLRFYYNLIITHIKICSFFGKVKIKINDFKNYKLIK